MANKIECNICWGKGIINSEWQKKVFNDTDSAITFCRKHYNSIQWINGFKTNGEPVSHFDILRALENPDEYI